jgi:hypothetical protein
MHATVPKSPKASAKNQRTHQPGGPRDGARKSRQQVFNSTTSCISTWSTHASALTNTADACLLKGRDTTSLELDSYCAPFSSRRIYPSSPPAHRTQPHRHITPATSASPRLLIRPPSKSIPHAHPTQHPNLIPPSNPHPPITLQDPQHLGTARSKPPYALDGLSDDGPVEAAHVVEIQDDADEPGVVHGHAHVLVDGEGEIGAYD